ncbi:inner membrane protein YpjD [Maricurvus nonylphenolicus]|uniref:cytochrome C assembly family protein n=1 Tax=Maricurvus nonylphenolicus TaxID=1008307 RepID=UPI0036F2F93A
MMTLAASSAAAALYLAASGYLISQTAQQRASSRQWLIAFAITALVLHGLGIYGEIMGDNGFDLSLVNAISLIFWVVNGLVLFSGLKKPLHNLFIFLFPISTLVVLGTIFSTQEGPALTTHSKGMISHILLSILAYSLLIIATLQSLLLAYQNYQLKHKHPRGLIRLLPPLQTMESLFFELLWIGEICLLGSIATGFIFVEDLFAQHLAHKTVFTLIAFSIYAILLWGRHSLGWRGNTAIRWALGGFAALMLAYFGSKLVLEVILG